MWLFLRIEANILKCYSTLVHLFLDKIVFTFSVARGVMDINKEREKNNKGFTLVEIIVVLVILAILAAFTIPTMLGFVEDAKAKAYIAEAREVYVAAQAAASEMVGADRSDLQTGSGNSYDALNSYWVSRCEQSGSKSYHNPASEKMKVYLENDMKMTQSDYRGSYAKGESYWYVIMGGTTLYPLADKGKVQEIYYVKNDYVIWFKEGAVTIEKLKPSGQRPNVPWNSV